LPDSGDRRKASFARRQLNSTALACRWGVLRVRLAKDSCKASVSALKAYVLTIDAIQYLEDES
jgi:hypothetical protein